MSKGGKIWRIGWRLAVCGVLLVWIFHAIFLNESQAVLGARWDTLGRFEKWSAAWTHGPAALWRNLNQISFGAFAAGTLVMAVTIVLGVFRWRMALAVQGLQLSLPRAAEISLVAHFFNSFLLGSTGGDLMKAYYAARETHHKKTEAVLTVFVDRLVGLWAMLLFAGLLMIPNWRLLLEHEILLATACLTLALLCACSVVVLLAFYGGVSKRWPGARQLLHRLPKGEWLEKSLDSCRQFGRGSHYVWKALGLSMLLNAVCVAQFLVLARGLGLDIEPAIMFLVVPMIICIAALPITPSGLGVRENLFVLLLAVPEVNVPSTSALSLSLLAFAGSLFWSGVGGGVYLFLKDRHHLEEVAREPDPANGNEKAPKAEPPPAAQIH